MVVKKREWADFKFTAKKGLIAQSKAEKLRQNAYGNSAFNYNIF